ncbi:conserved hypothetical protein [Chthoniobacter flavus Ellin428]|uniref:Photosynthesis system II assembly factor Ycf48/Hcf136-like domain-containing protein n=1 Tax=Chthoniobacter flavus Ellin428 TaxID=497964 RepID=B4D7Q4_9BACT|nr:hypothetical protein [Chthoniobacter flavus]EDY17544.1 conserved hypothetical protein [Chthoniobacter flavus Ellin428]TCO92423.1 hypothetical protein EV701_106192 [Chthoniobacter flavus]
MFLAVGHQGARILSKDGLTWEKPTLGKDGEVYRAAAFGNGRFAVVGTFGGENIMASSADGAKWDTGKRDAKYSHYFRGIAFGNGIFLAAGGDPTTVGVGKPFVAVSKDGAAWDDNVPIDGKFILRRLAFGKGIWVGVGDRGRLASSADATTWTDTTGTKPIDTLVDVTFGNGVFVGVGLNGLRRTSNDGKTWTDPLRGNEGEHLNSIVFTGNQFVAVGAGATYFSADGKDWKRAPNKNAPTFATFGGGVFVGTSWRGRLLRSMNAVDWADAHKCDQPIEAVAYGAKL